MNQRATCAALWFGLLCGCATPPPITPIRSGDSVVFDVLIRPQADGPIVISNQAMADDGTTGAAAGIVAGGLTGLACGPFMALCIPAFAIMGGATGGLVGTVVGITGQLPAEKATQLRERLIQLRQSYDPRDDLRNNINERARRHWDLDSETPKSIVTVVLYDMMLHSTRDERIRLAMRVLVTVRPSDAPQPATPKPYEIPPSPGGIKTAGGYVLPPLTPNEKVYEYVGSLSSVTSLLDERNDALHTVFRTASQQVAAQIVAELALN